LEDALFYREKHFGRCECEDSRYFCAGHQKILIPDGTGKLDREKTKDSDLIFAIERLLKASAIRVEVAAAARVSCPATQPTT
jgi:hypothetical protein